MTRRAAVVGCGFIGAGAIVPGSGVQSHAGAWTRHPATTLVALCDTDSGRLAAAATRWQVSRCYHHLDRMLAEVAPEIVSIATPDPTHPAILDQVLAAPSVEAILVEKPLALTLADAERAVRAASARGVVLAVNYVRRFAPSHRAIKQWLETAPLGEIELVHGCYGRGLKHNGTHWLDLARWWLGEITTATGCGTVAADEADPTIDVALEFGSGARGFLHGLERPGFSLFEMDLIGTTGRARVTDGGQRVEVWASAPSARFPGFEELVPAPGPAGGLTDLLLHAAGDLVEALATGRAPGCTGADAIAALRLAVQAIESTRVREVVDAIGGR